MIDLYRIARHMGLRPNLVMEIGANEPHRCSLSGFIKDGVRAVLVEPLPWCAENLRKAFPNAEVIEAACGEREGKVVLFDRGEGSWIEDVKEGDKKDVSSVEGDGVKEDDEKDVASVEVAADSRGDGWQALKLF